MRGDATRDPGAAPGAGRLRMRSAAAGLAKEVLVSVQVLAWRLRRPAGPTGLRILFYHRVSNDRDQLAVSPARFRKQMEILAHHGVEVVDLTTLSPGALPAEAIAITFDDGYEDFAEHALPALRHHGFPATVFVCPGLVSGAAVMPWYRTGRQPRLLSWEQMREVERSDPVRFEPHTMTHPDLVGLPEPEARDEIRGSREAVEAELGRPARVFCYPAGYAGDREVRLVSEAGFVLGVTCESGVNTAGADPLLLTRTPVDRYDPAWLFRDRLKGATDGPLPLRRRRAR